MRDDFNGILFINLLPPDGNFTYLPGTLLRSSMVEHRIKYPYPDAIAHDKGVSSLAVKRGIASVTLSLPGYAGSSGEKSLKNTAAGIKLISKAIDELKSVFKARDVVVWGGSSTGHIVAVLLAERTDMRCAIIGSAPLDLDVFYELQPIMIGWAGTNDPVNPMEIVDEIPKDLDTSIYIGYHQKDKIVPAAAQLPFAKALEQKGLDITIEEFVPIESTYHSSINWSYKKIFQNCNTPR